MLYSIGDIVQAKPGCISLFEPKKPIEGMQYRISNYSTKTSWQYVLDTTYGEPTGILAKQEHLTLVRKRNANDIIYYIKKLMENGIALSKACRTVKVNYKSLHKEQWAFLLKYKRQLKATSTQKELKNEFLMLNILADEVCYNTNY